MQKLLLIAIAGAVGTVARYGTQTAFAGVSERFPYGTLAVNLVGCLAIGFLQALFADRLLMRPEYRIAILVGLLGGYTTFSTFGLETRNLLEAGEYWRAGWNVVATNIGCIAMVFVGYAIGAKL